MCFSIKALSMVRIEGVEPPRLAALEPKSSASTSSAISANELLPCGKYLVGASYNTVAVWFKRKISSNDVNKALVGRFHRHDRLMPLSQRKSNRFGAHIEDVQCRVLMNLFKSKNRQAMGESCAANLLRAATDPRESCINKPGVFYLPRLP